MSWIWRRHCGDGHGRLSAYAHRTLQAITFSAGSDVAVSSVGGAEFRSAITSHMRMCHRYELLEADVPSVVDHSFEPVGLPALPKVTHEKHVHFLNLFFPLSPPHVRPPNADVEAVVDDSLRAGGAGTLCRITSEIRSCPETDLPLAPRRYDLPEADVQAVVDHCLQLVGLAGFQRRSSHTLSGGERQRLAVAGALAQVQALLKHMKGENGFSPSWDACLRRWDSSKVLVDVSQRYYLLQQWSGPHSGGPPANIAAASAKQRSSKVAEGSMNGQSYRRPRRCCRRTRLASWTRATSRSV